MKSYSEESVSLEQCKNDFVSILRETKREGIETLLNWLEKTQFYVAPASTKFHESREGGLLRHSLNVYTRLVMEFSHEQALKPASEKLMTEEEVKKAMDSIAIVALLHDLCKSDSYVISTRNQKQPDGTWEQVPFYKMNDQRLPYGHGEKSVYMISGFIRLTREEAIAIRFHMGDFEGALGNETGLAFEQFELATLLHIADLKATYIDEVGTKFGS